MVSANQDVENDPSQRRKLLGGVGQVGDGVGGGLWEPLCVDVLKTSSACLSASARWLLVWSNFMRNPRHVCAFAAMSSCEKNLWVAAW